ncbi:MAG: nucleotide pyrophosphohydrolase [Alphaproteobacteria bacterium]|nr:nucleotide pyrophosphohydrolase [Alphaproteobacteria bacterium]MBF0249871.1 nucleotide pyrophosphohydrolase [Alphaproteobacteria bacterium]
MTDSIQDLTSRLTRFRDDRDWRRFHNLKDLIQSVGIEAGELMELTQWKDTGTVEDLITNPDFRARLAEEVSDVFLYLLLIAERAGLDIVDEAHRKIDLNDAKYPVEKARGTAKKYTEL